MDRKDRDTTLGPRGTPDCIYQSWLEGEYELDRLTTKQDVFWPAMLASLSLSEKQQRGITGTQVTCGCKIHSFFLFFWVGEGVSEVEEYRSH